MEIATDPIDEHEVVARALQFANYGKKATAAFLRKIEVELQSARTVSRYHGLLISALESILQDEIPDDSELTSDREMPPIATAVLALEDGILTVFEYETPTVASLVMLATHFLSQPYWIDRLRKCPQCGDYFIRREGRKQTTCGDPGCRAERNQTMAVKWESIHRPPKIKRLTAK